MISGSSVVSYQKLFKKLFADAYNEMASGNLLTRLNMLATEVASANGSEDYRWFGSLPVVKEWLGDVTVGDLAEYDFTIKNKHWYTSFAVDKDEFDDDGMGMIQAKTQFMVQQLLHHKSKLMHDLLVDGTSNLAYDGAAFFSNRSVNDNLLAGTGVTTATLETDLDTARQTMMQFKSDTGEIMGVLGDTIVCPPALERKFRTVVESSSLASGSNSAAINPFKGWIKEVIVDANLTDTNDWYLLCTTMPIKPFVYQNRKNPELWIDDTQLKRNRKYIFGADYRGNAGYGLYQLAVKTVNS